MYAPLAGTVSGVGFHAGAGNYIQIEHEDKFVTRYYHLLEKPTLVAGATVTGGDQIGQVGRTGTTTGNHLHFEVYENEVDADNGNKKTQTSLNPIKWLSINPTATFPVAVDPQ